MVATKAKKAKPPKGFAQLPDWWMEITPHNTLDGEGDAVKRKNTNDEATIFRSLAAKSDWEQLNADSNYTLSDNGELFDKETGKIIETGGNNSPYQRDEKTGEWLKDGKPIFKGRLSDYTANSGGVGGVGGGRGPEYGHKDLTFKKPDWMKVKLKGTGNKDKNSKYLY